MARQYTPKNGRRPKNRRKARPRDAGHKSAIPDDEITVVSPAHENFINGLLDGMTATAAYRKYIARGKVETSTCMAAGCRLKQNAKIAARLQERKRDIRDWLKEKHNITAETLTTRLMEMAETPLGELDEMHPLATEVTRRRKVTMDDDEPQEWEVLKIKKDSPLSALKALASLAGLEAPKKLTVDVDVASPELRAAVAKFFED